MIRLLSYDNCPPGEFYFVQSEGVYHKFKATPLIKSLAKRVADFRLANKLPRSDASSALADIDAFTCTRLNNSPQWCYDTDAPIPDINPSSGGCATCGHH